jgi:hypothetical protein
VYSGRGDVLLENVRNDELAVLDDGENGGYVQCEEEWGR